MASGKGKLRFFVKQIMQMNVLASAVLFLLIGPFDFVSSWDVESTDSASVLQVLSPAHVFISVNDVLELNCSIRGPSHGLLPTQLLWRHNDTWVHNSSSVVDNSTVQLKFHTHYKDAGVYRCEVFYNSSSFKKATSKNITVIVGEKPKLGRCPLSIVNVLGRPVQALTLQWTALQINVTNSLIVGKIQNFNCVTQDRTFCSQTPRIRNELLSCYLGKDVLREVFQWSELHGTCADGSNGTRCDVFCAKLKVESKFGASESNTSCCWILHSKARCPPPRNMSVTLGERSITVSWLRPQLVWTNYSVYYRLAYNGTQLLMGKSLPKYRPLRRHFEELSYTINDIEPFTRYTITLACTLSGYSSAESGPAIFTEVISREEVPSKAPICEVVNRSIDGDAFVLLKPLPKYRWNGIPKKYVVYYNSGDQQRRVNVSLDGLNATEPLPVRITNIDVRKKYSVTATMCTVAGCGQNSDPPCFIPMIHTKEPSDEIETVPQTPADSTTGATLEAIIAASAVFAGLFLAILVICWIKRRRSRKKQRPSLETLFTGLNDSRLYENDADDGPSLCDESQAYDTIPRALLLKNINCPVSEI